MYQIVNFFIYNKSVPISGNKSQSGQGFKNTLSSGDRNALALAFFFAMLEQEPNLSDKLVIIDDPMTSLDDHRTLTTAQEIRKMSRRTAQVIVLSHAKPFLCQIWEHADKSHRSAIQITREGDGSTIKKWNVRDDIITEYDRKHELLRKYSTSSNNIREIAESIRPVLEGYLRVACPEHFPPATLLGDFITLCRQKMSSPQEIMNQKDTDELNDMKEYANKFHHDTNPAWETETINNGQLLGFVERTLTFIKKR